jgi:hypothetical protein
MRLNNPAAVIGYCSPCGLMILSFFRQNFAVFIAALAAQVILILSNRVRQQDPAAKYARAGLAAEYQRVVCLEEKCDVASENVRLAAEQLLAYAETVPDNPMALEDAERPSPRW